MGRADECCFCSEQIQQPVGYQFDDTGDKAQNELLIKDGVLVAGIGGTESQHRSNVRGTASARVSNWNRPQLIEWET